jgi:hypothetical protein
MGSSRFSWFVRRRPANGTLLLSAFRRSGWRQERSDSAVFNPIALLVVSVNPGILAAIVLPALSKAKEQGRRLVCISNVKLIHLTA